MLHFLDVYTVYLTTKCVTGTTAVGDARWRSDNMGILNVIESGMQNKRLIFGMDPGLTHFKALSTFCTRLHIQDSTLRLPWSVIDAVHICWRCCETAQRQSSWLDFANIGMKTMTDFSLSHLSGLFSHFTSFYPQLLTTLLTCVCLAQFKVNLFSKCCCADWIFHFAFLFVSSGFCVRLVILTEPIFGTFSFNSTTRMF